MSEYAELTPENENDKDNLSNLFDKYPKEEHTFLVNALSTLVNSFVTYDSSATVSKGVKTYFLIGNEPVYTPNFINKTKFATIATFGASENMDRGDYHVKHQNLFTELVELGLLQRVYKNINGTTVEMKNLAVVLKSDAQAFQRAHLYLK